uniref:Uncharacterized protein n=1 Tax=Photinus pyralis TaxID=7054 RepID=A0A1Y1JY25_PHOPY
MRLGNVNGDLMRAGGAGEEMSAPLFRVQEQHPRARSSVALCKRWKRRSCARFSYPSLVRDLRPLQLESLYGLWHGILDSGHFRGYPFAENNEELGGEILFSTPSGRVDHLIALLSYHIGLPVPGR